MTDVNLTSPVDPVNVCILAEYFMAALYENKIYSIGGLSEINANLLDDRPDTFLRIVDFSKPVDSAKNSIDIRTNIITTAIALADDIPSISGGVLFISDGVMHMFPGIYYSPITFNGTAHRPDLAGRVWDFDLQSQKWDVQFSGIEVWTRAATAFDTEQQVGWIYGGDSENTSMITDQTGLYRLDRGKRTPIKVKTDSPPIGIVSSGELVHIGGAGKAGILVLMGGADGGSIFSPMQTVHVFDISTNTWFTQNTTAPQGFYPINRMSFCSVVASAEDNSSHNIYIYGGLLEHIDNTTPEVFILTLPAFQWIAVHSSASDHSYYNTYEHRCLKVHEKYMVVYRGSTSAPGFLCDNDPRSHRFQGMLIYDMSSPTWTTIVELENQSYLVPQVLYEVIGGNAVGNATTTQPSNGFQDPGLGEVFLSNTTQAPGPTYHPPNGTIPNNAIPAPQHTPSVGVIVGGTVGGFIFILFIILLYFLGRRRIAAAQKPPRVSEHVPELASTPIQPQELQECGLYELQHGSRVVLELPSSAVEPGGPVPVQPQELQECGLYELQHGSRIELPSSPVQPGGPVPEEWRRAVE